MRKGLQLNSTDRIVFFGDSITEQGEFTNGYVTLIRTTLQRKHPGILVIGAGISGDKVPQLRERLDRDVLSQRPTLVVVYIGINDVWHCTKHGTGTPKTEYESGLREITRRILRTGARVVLCTPSVIGERRHGANELDAMLDGYADITRLVAKEPGAGLCDLRTTFIRYLATHNPHDYTEGVLTLDSVHLNDAGNRLVAESLLATLME